MWITLSLKHNRKTNVLFIYCRNYFSAEEGAELQVLR